MDLPETTHPSRLDPEYLRAFVLSGLAILAIAGGITVALPYLGFLPFQPYYLYVLSILPIFKALSADRRRKHKEYVFKEDRVIIKKGHRTVEQEDVPYSKITDVTSSSPPIEQTLDVGSLNCHIAGTNKNIEIVGLRHPQKYEDLILSGGRTEEPDTVHTSTDDIQQRLNQIEQQYNNGEIGRAEYERNYYYYKGQLDLLEQQQ